MSAIKNSRAPLRRTRLHQIGAVAREVALPPQVIRQCVESGHLSPSGRGPNGDDLFTDDDIERLRLLRPMVVLGGTRQEVSNVVSAYDHLRSTRTADPIAKMEESDLRRLSGGELFAEDLQRLERGGLSGAERARILDRLAMFAVAVDERRRQLAEELEEAEATAATLRRQIQLHGRFSRSRS